MIIEQIKLKNQWALAIRLELDHAPLLIIRAGRGYLMCGYLNISAASKLGDIAARVTGVQNFEDMLKAEISEFSDAAQKMGFKPGITGLEFLNGLDNYDNI